MGPKSTVGSRHWSCSLKQMSIIGLLPPLQHSSPALSLLYPLPAHLALLLAFYHTQHIPIPEPEPWGSLGLGYSSSDLCKSLRSQQKYHCLREALPNNPHHPSHSPSHYSAVDSLWCLQQSEIPHFFMVDLS